jgi:site-specific recombinase XerD
MGHRSLHITLRYTQLYDATKRHPYDQAMEKIETRQAGLGRCPMHPVEVEPCCEYLRLRNYAPHTIESYRLDLRLVFAAIAKPVRRISWRDVGRFMGQQHDQGLAPTPINRRRHALTRFFDFLILDEARRAVNPVKPSHDLKQGRALPKPLSAAHITPLCATIEHPLDRALFLVMLRGGLRVSEVASLKVSAIDWAQHA